MLYTRKGDSGTTKAFNSKSSRRISKSSCQTEALGVLDELNSFSGLVKLKSAELSWTVNEKRPTNIVRWVQNCLFTIQAEVAGSDEKIVQSKVDELEKFIDVMEKEMPPIKTFFVSGGVEIAALFDISRALARKVERRVIGGLKKKEYVVCQATLAYLNRLSSLFYALARLTNRKSGITEEPPSYE
jgi:cob(I)alamin adenosyltransferase